ncbi:DNA excision repair protein ERCC-8, partial [Lecanoromycetidae sp. Uapishka_2]
MTSNLFGRALGLVSPQALQKAETERWLRSLQAAPGIKFDGSEGAPHQSSSKDENENREYETIWAHRAGVNCITIDRFEGRYMLSGGAESSINLWDLESAENTLKRCTYKPLAKANKASAVHKFGITHLSFYPFDSLAFLSTSYDHTLKVCATETLTASASFGLGSVAYSHSISTIADHLLVACATQHPAVRLVDLRTAASAHSLAGHQGAVLSVAWSPYNEHLLASGGSDGTVRLWDIRRSAGSLGLLDLEDSVGIGGEDGLGKNARPRHQGKAHVGACNGVVWTDDGKFLVTAGHDERVRVWDVGIGANALSHFGPIIKNTHLSTLLPLIVPSNVGRSGQHTMLYPNEKEILMFDLSEGTLHNRLRATGATVAQASGSTGQRNIRNRVTSITWRAGAVEFYSAHSDGVIRSWKPQTQEEIEVEKDRASELEDGEDGEDDSRKRKRHALEEVFRDMTRQKITFT